MERRGEKRKKNKGNPRFPAIWLEVIDDLGLPAPVKADVIDVSEQGLGLSIEKPLNPGQAVRFIKKEPAHHPDNGIVMWTSESTDGFRVGVLFS